MTLQLRIGIHIILRFSNNKVEGENDPSNRARPVTPDRKDGSN